MNLARSLSCLAVLVVLVGCTPTTGAPMPTDSPTSPMPSSWPSGRPPLQTTSPLPTGSPAEVSSQRWQAILDHLSEQGVAGTPELVSAEAVTWPDSSLGCPSPGVSYTQALVDGMRVIVSVDGKRYDFRFGAGTDLKLCQQKRQG
ncbi:MAG: hypothetical protein KIT69_10090 [Propionibacteriaceae bacterium]|nr:hypothetical protein [Propionibacteriaceae bacterium]